jgi:hypothetical protein
MNRHSLPAASYILAKMFFLEHESPLPSLSVPLSGPEMYVGIDSEVSEPWRPPPLLSLGLLIVGLALLLELRLFDRELAAAASNCFLFSNSLTNVFIMASICTELKAVKELGGDILGSMFLCS